MTLFSNDLEIRDDSGNAIPTNETQLGGTSIDTNSGTKSAGTQRIVIATDQPQLTNALTTAGNKTNNNAAPGATNLGTLPGVATNAAPTYIEGNQVALSTDLTGALRISGGGGGTQYAEDSAHVSGDTVTMAGVVQQTADSALSSDGDRSLLQVDSSGYLKVNVKAQAGSSGLSVTDSAAWTVASSSFTPMGGEYNDLTVPLTSGTQGTARLTSYRGQHVNIRDSSGNELGVWNKPLIVDILDAQDTVNVGGVGGNDIATVAPGVQLVAQAGPTGDPVDTIGNALSVAAAQNGNWNVSNNVEVGTLFNYVESTTSISVKTSAGYLLSILITNYNSTKRYFQVFDQKAAPATGNTATLSIPIPGGTSNAPGYLELGPAFFGSGGLATLQGIAIGVSTANTTYGAATSTDHTIAGLFV